MTPNLISGDLTLALEYVWCQLHMQFVMKIKCPKSESTSSICHGDIKDLLHRYICIAFMLNVSQLPALTIRPKLFNGI